MVAKAPNFVFNFLFVARVSFLEGFFAFADILSFTFAASAQIYYPGAITVHPLPDSVLFPCACTLEDFALYHYRAGHLAPVTLEATCIWGGVLTPASLALKTPHYSLEVFGLPGRDLDPVTNFSCLLISC